MKDMLFEQNDIQKYFKDGIELEKGVSLNEERIIKNEKLYQFWCNLFTAYPDIFVDLITPEESNFELFFYQRIFLRACLRYRYHYCVAPRAFSKTFISILGLFLECIFKPGFKCFICAPKKEQGAKIAREKVDEILDLFPLLRKELVKDNYTAGSDYLKMVFRNGSVFDVIAALDSTRGGRRAGGLIDEVRDHNADTLNEIVLPLLNVNRRTKARIVNPNENHQQQLYMTSAGVRTSYAYQRLIELLEQSIIAPNSTFIWGCDYRVPMMHGLLDKTYLNEIKMSKTFKDDSFAREYLGKWTGSGTDSWFDYDRLQRYRKLLNPESSQKLIKGSDIFYLLSVDVGRLSCQTVVTVFKVFRNSESFNINLVNLYILGRTEQTKHFSIQALDLKKIIAAFDAEEIVIDTNGLGVGLMDYMVQESYDSSTNQYYPAYCSFNNDDYRQSLYPQAIPKIYVMKSNNTLESKINGNCYAKVYSGKIQFLAQEQEVKNRLLATKKGQNMKIEKRVARVYPHEMTTRLFEEMANFKLKPTGNGTDIKLEKINSRTLSDKYSSFAYGLWRIKEKEEEYYNKKRRKGGRNRKLVFFTQGGG